MKIKIMKEKIEILIVELTEKNKQFQERYLII